MSRPRKWNRIDPINGWVLICREEKGDGEPKGDWCIAWPDQFKTRRAAREFAGLNNWSHPWQAVRSQLSTNDRVQ